MKTTALSGSVLGDRQQPEALKENLSGLWSRRIDDVNRLVYAIEKDQLVIITCRYHYE